MAVILAVVVFLLGQGSNLARMLVSVVMVVRIGVSLWALFALGTHQMGEALIAIATAVFALALLWNSKASSFFAGHQR